MQIITKAIAEIIPYDKNPRNNNKAVEPVAESIKAFGFKVPIVIDKDNVIVAGHTRYRAAQKLGLKEVPCIMADDLNEEQVKAYRLADNKVAELATWDEELLAEELEGLSEIDMTAFGFDLGVDDEVDNVQEDDFSDDDIPEETTVKRGQIYQLGRHRLMCGDSTNSQDVKKLVGGVQMDLCVTDPPYNVNYKGGQGKKDHIENDNMSSEDFYKFLKAAFANIQSTLKPGGSFYVWFASKEHINFEKALNDNNLYVRQELIWNKSQFILGRQDYQNKHEPCLYGWKEGAAHYFVDIRNLTNVIEDSTSADFNKMKKNELIKMLEDIFSEKRPTTVIDEKKPAVNDIHPTMKPIKLIARLVANSSKPDQNVIDLFGGSGTTIMACEQLGRNCYMMEYDPIFADAIIHRYEELTGEPAILIEE